ncbi:MAG: MCP four helix bundle domain-containing protein [Proteobacteria bacterium]|nr:MCP four helix bundle domain-containing protein [Pseudomonadota bacterium]
MFAPISRALNNFSIKVRIASSFAMLVIVIATLGGFAIDAAGRIHQATVEIQTSWLPSVRELATLRYLGVRHRAIAGRHVMLESDPDKVAVDGRLAKILEEINATRRRYQPLISSQQERDLYRAADAKLNEYLAAIDKYVALSHAHQKDEATTAYAKVASPISIEAEVAIGKVIALNDQGATDAEARSQAVFAATRQLIVAGIVGALLLACLAGWYLIRNVAKPVIAMTTAMGRLADHDIDVAIPAVGQKDEIGRMADAVQVFKDNMIKGDELAAAQAEAQAARERRTQLIDELTQRFDHEVNGVVQGLAAASTELQSSAASMSATAEEASRQSSAVAAASEQTSANVQTVATATEQLNASIAEIGTQINQSATIARNAVEQAAETDRTMKALNDGAQKIGTVVKLINDIASQTNLLALNATIEAARAGEAGKGFAVVATEVKNLASQTARATEEISSQIGAIQAETARAAHAIEAIGRTITAISESATTMASAVEEQGAATREIARNVQQAAGGTQEVTGNIAGVSQAAGETGAAAAMVLSASGDVARGSSALKDSVTTFLTRVKAA